MTIQTHPSPATMGAQDVTQRPLWLWCLFPAITMSLGWGLRGFIGGGPLGAMIPGALVALALCLLLDRDHDDAGVIAAFGAVGVGFGGQMTYGQTIGFLFQPGTLLWGLAGLTLKGAIWGFLAAAVIALALTRHRHERKTILLAFAAMVAATYAGWKLINEPKLIYFSNPIDRPRPELWAGLLSGALALLAVLRSRVSWRFAAYGLIGGGLGFGFGGWLQYLGRTYADTPWIGYWKVMELFFGFLFGLALGACAWKLRADLQGEPVSPMRMTLPVTIWRPLLLGAILVAAALYAAETLPSRLRYTILGGVLMGIALVRPGAGWQIAVTVTYGAFSYDFIEYQWSSLNHTALWTFVVATTTAVAGIVARWPRTFPMFLLLLWTANANSYAKSFIPVVHWNGHTLTEIAFTLMGAAATWMAYRIHNPPSRS